ncbi:hypothetical protein Sango_3107200 [Sesamum angolense]|uniref:MULE transposase domain-containing protein n=1 Tax=Sesamum angolense TaxID=2727404 RepID=A0AAE1T9H9_9LAMI|nr:hypothetical protein Sango_3107200 [Sesamum angolense]
MVWKVRDEDDSGLAYGDLVPDYGPGNEKFTIRMHHSGEFINLGSTVYLEWLGFVEKQKVNENLIENESVGEPEHIDNKEGEEEHSVEQPSIDNKQSSDDGDEQSVGEDSDFSDRLVDSEFELSDDDIMFDSNIDPDLEWRGFYFNNSINVEQETSELGSQFSDGTQSTHHGHPIFNKRIDVEDPKFELGIKCRQNVNMRHVLGLFMLQKCKMKTQCRTKKRVEKMGGGTDGEQYAMLWSYAEEIRNSNPSTTVKIKSKLVGGLPQFKRLYICWGALKQGFLMGCRPIICLDGCHLKSSVGGILLSAVGIDANNCIYPFAYAVVEKEKKKNWLWFLEMLVQDLNITHSYGWTIMSDKQKGLIDAVDQFCLL